jgi:hypothetical protein
VPQISIVWHYPGNKIIDILEKQGYEKAGVIANYWYNDSKEKGYQCQICDNPCKCDALIMVKNFSPVG